MSHKRCLWFSFVVFFHHGKLCGTWFPPQPTAGAELPGVSGDEESKGKGEAKQRHSRGSERNETLTPHPDVKTLGEFFVYLETYHFVYNMFSSNIIFREVNCMRKLLLILDELYMIGVSLVLVSCCIFSINPCDHPMRFPWSRGRILTPKKRLVSGNPGKSLSLGFMDCTGCFKDFHKIMLNAEVDTSLI